MRRKQESFVPTEEALRRHYAGTALARMGIQFEEAMGIEAVQRVVKGAARAEERKRAESENCT